MNKIIAIILMNFLFIGYTPKKENKDSKSLIADFDKNIVQTAYGKVRGYQLGETFIFKGIPYAKAERFMPPQEPDSWEGVRNSMAYGYMCPQQIDRGNDESAFLHQHSVGYMDEDCMRLNIWTPGINDGKKRPVMLWFHGGGFTAGSGQDLPCYDGENLSKKGNIVLINLNHRLNALGFMNLSDFGDKYKYSGNVGIMDLVAALQWINKNIAQFGGDPDNVTIFGQSGGGGKVTALLGAPSAQGLFHKAIIHSGARTYFLEDKYSKMIGQGVLKELGLKSSEVDSLQKIPYEILIAASNKVIRRLNDEIKNTEVPLYNSNFSWNPCVDGNFMPFHPTAKEALTLNAEVPIIIGSNKNESGPFSQSVTGGPKTIEEAEKKLRRTFGDKTDEYIELVKKIYPHASRPIDFVNIDTGYRTRTLALAAHRSQTNPVYVYFFQWNSPVIDGRFQSHHSLEIPFVFNNIDKCREMTGGGKEAYKLAGKMSQAWINFARTGNPNREQLPSWPVFSEANGSCMVFDNVCEVRSHHDRELLEYVNKHTAQK
jgi:para-nitrobenzyl esterase